MQYDSTMPPRSQRLNVTLDAEHAEKLAQLAESTHVNEGTLARSLLSTAIDEADPAPRSIVDLLEGIPGALEEAQRRLAEARAGGKTIPLEDL